MSIDWRASLVPAAAVIPAPIAYIKIVAVKTLVVGCLPSLSRSPKWSLRGLHLGSFSGNMNALQCVSHYPFFYFEEISVFQAGLCRVYGSME